MDNVYTHDGVGCQEDYLVIRRDTIGTMAKALPTVLFGVAAALQVLHAAPLPGQIVAVPGQPEWLAREGAGPFFLCGPGDPEDFLYRGTRNADGTRDGDQDALIDKIKGTGANSIYLMAFRTFGDGPPDHNPFVNSNFSGLLDQDILDQWEIWFTEMDDNGIVIYFFFYDDDIDIANTLGWPLDAGGNLHSQEQYFIEGLVNEFEHHENLVWVVGEEAQEMGVDYEEHTKKIAEVIRQADDHDHVIGAHKLTGIKFNEFADDPNIDQFLIQNKFGVDADFLHDWMVSAWGHAAGRYNLNMAEARNHGFGDEARHKNWGIAMGGAYVMAKDWDIDTTPLADLQQCGYLVSFMESTNFNDMAPHDELAHGGAQFVLADPSSTSYIAYARSLVGDIGLTGMTAGNYDFTWLDTVTGATVEETTIAVAAGDQTWVKPAAVGTELAVFIRPAAIGGIVGDVDDDGTIDVGDLLLLERALTDEVTLDAGQQYRADVHPAGAGDGMLTVSDLAELRQTLTGQ